MSEREREQKLSPRSGPRIHVTCQQVYLGPSTEVNQGLFLPCLLSEQGLLAFVTSHVPIMVQTPMVRPLTYALLCCVQGQGALSERLRSFSMQDLTTIRGDGAPAPSGPPPPGTGRSSGKHSQPKMSRSASESAGSSGRLFPVPLIIKKHSIGWHTRCPLPHKPVTNRVICWIVPGQMRNASSSGPLRKLGWGLCLGQVRS